MRIVPGSNDEDVIDVRGASSGRSLPSGRVAIPSGVGLIGLLIILGLQLLSGATTYDVPTSFNQQAAEVTSDPLPATSDPDLALKDFSVAVFHDVQTMWGTIFRESNVPYTRAKLVLYRQAVRTACGSATSAVGPFYCPADQRVYLDLSFQREMRDQLGADGDFAWAYVIAHEMGHHAQQELGTDARVRQLTRDNPDSANALSVRTELQADCYAGVWAQRAYRQGQLEPGDLEEGLNAASAVGDDRLQQRASGQIRPDTFTHGSSEQRVRWFTKGYDSGNVEQCDTFGAENL